MDDRQEATRAAYEDCTGRTDYTPGDWPIPQSPFKTLAEFVKAMDKLTDMHWTISSFQVGGRGERPCIFNGRVERVIYLWRDASGGWHPEHKVGANWLPDLELLDKLIAVINPQEFDDEPASGNYTAAEVDYMRHPD